MSHRTKFRGIRLHAMLALILWAGVVRPVLSGSPETKAANHDHPSHAFSYEGYSTVLKTFVDDNGMVNYRDLKSGSAPLEAFLSSVESLHRTVHDTWSVDEKVAFWINVYNACTLKAILTNYPIQSSWVASLRFPRNSIRQIPGVWTELLFRIMGENVSLDQIEHEKLRAQYGEPRIHVALVCASMGCPPLRTEPYLAGRLDEQLDDQAWRFLSSPNRFRIDRSNGVVYLSPIFKWFGEDFVNRYGTDAPSAGRNRTERAVLSFIRRHVERTDAQYLAQAEYSLAYLEYDWSLNEPPQQESRE